MEMLDWSIVIGLVALMTLAAFKTKKYNRSVADFLAANRCARRYVLGVSEGIAGIGAISVIGAFEAYYEAGFSFAWWAMLLLLVTNLAAATGWISYRYRQTRALTMAQFFEVRYSRRFRIFAGILIFVSGTINFGIFPAVGARFFKYFCGLQDYNVLIFNSFTIDLTFAGIVFVILSISLIFTFLGGQIAVMVTDFIQGTFANIAICIIVGFILVKFPWHQIIETLSQRPPGESMLHPFQSGNTADFNPWYYIIAAIGMFYTFMAWQGGQGYFASAVNAHEARMGKVISSWRTMTQQLIIFIIPICAFVLFHHVDWSAQAEAANQILDTISTDPGNTIRKQVATTAALVQFLPVGLMGAFAAFMLAAFISTHDTYLHSWGSIFIQDVLLPFRKVKHLDKDKHLSLLKKSIFGVALFVFLFSLIFPQNDYILMFFTMTGTLWLGGAGTVIVGGLYWKKGTTSAAYAALIVGIVFCLSTFILPRIWEDFPLNAQWMWFLAMISSTIAYVSISLFGKKAVFNMDKMLHRGKYAIADDETQTTTQPVRGFKALFGMGSDFTFGDRVIYLFITGWSIVWGLIFLIGTAYNYIFDVKIESWNRFWHFYVWLVLIMGIFTTIWLTIGGISDLRKLFKRLRMKTMDDQDDGTV